VQAPELAHADDPRATALVAATARHDEQQRAGEELGRRGRQQAAQDVDQRRIEAPDGRVGLRRGHQLPGHREGEQDQQAEVRHPARPARIDERQQEEDREAAPDPRLAEDRVQTCLTSPVDVTTTSARLFCRESATATCQ
jgi:hypothetical protein